MFSIMVLPKHIQFNRTHIFFLSASHPATEAHSGGLVANINKAKDSELYQYLRSKVCFFVTKLRRNSYLTPNCDLLHVICFYFQNLSIKYLLNATFGTSLAFKMCVIERLEKVNFCTNLRSGPT